MSHRIELEKSFYLDDRYEQILNRIKEEKFTLTDEVVEEDTYFTDKEQKFIEDKVCLRIRKTDNKFVELTYKPKTTLETELYGKKETNINLTIEDYEDIKYLLKELGYVEYVSLKKYRKTYSKIINNFEYNIMIDKIDDVGRFIEIEILAQDYSNKDEASLQLDSFIKMMGCQGLMVKEKPYRDLVKGIWGRSLKSLLEGILRTVPKSLFMEVESELQNYKWSNKLWSRNSIRRN